MTKKVCSACSQEKNLTDFRRDKTRPDGRAYVCKSCYKDKYHPSAAERTRLANLSKKYGITEKIWTKILIVHNWHCAICGVHELDLDYNLCVDHDHKTGKVRGPLCKRCNSAIGLLDEDTFRMQKAIDYLTRHQPKGNDLEG